MKILDVYVSKVRTLLGPHREAIQTVWGRGWSRDKRYRWVEIEPTTIAMPVNQHWLGELCAALDKPPEVVLDDILLQAYRQIVLGG